MTGIVVKNNNVKASARKLRQVCDLIRNKSAKEALSILRFCEKRELAIVVAKLINSGLDIANQQELDLELLKVGEVFVNEGPTLKRIRPRAQGRAFRIRYRSSYLTLKLV